MGAEVGKKLTIEWLGGGGGRQHIGVPGRNVQNAAECDDCRSLQSRKCVKGAEQRMRNDVLLI